MTTKKYRLIISGIFLLAILVRLICFVGLIGSDDLSYNQNAYKIATGTFTPQPNHQDSRLGIFFPVAGAFKLFGVNELSSILFPFFCFIITFILLVYTTTTYFGKWPGILAGVLYTFLPIEIFHATMLLTDLPSATFIALSGVILFRADDSQRKEKSAFHRGLFLFLGGLLLGWAYLIKETAVFFGVFVVGYMLSYAWKHKTVHWSWIGFWLGCLTVVGIEAGYYFLTTGEPFFRYVSVQSGHNASIFSGTHFQGFSLLRRLTLDQFWVLFHVPDFSFYYVFILAGVIYALPNTKRPLRFFTGWFLTIFLLFNFGSTSVSEYSPLLLFHRFFIILSLPGILILSWFLYEMRHFFVLEERADITRLRLSFLIPFILLVLINIFWFSLIQTLFLVVLFLLIVLTFSQRLRYWWKRQCSPNTLMLTIPLLLLYIILIPGIYSTAKGEPPRKGITCEREIRPALGDSLTHTIYTDMRTEEILEYYYDYQYDEQIKDFEESASTVESWEDAYVIVNRERLFFLQRVHDVPIPEFIREPLPSWQPYIRLGDDMNPCFIYKIPKK